MVGAAGKAVVYQWEARKRTPSPLFWQRIIALRVPAVSPSATGARPQEHLRLAPRGLHRKEMVEDLAAGMIRVVGVRAAYVEVDLLQRGIDGPGR